MKLNMNLQRKNVYEKLRDAITYGELKPGEKMVEMDICERFNVGRTPLREAFRKLEAENYIDVSPNKGATVRKVSVDELEHIYDIMSVMEGYAVELATGVILEKDKKNLKKIVKDLDKAAKAKDHRDWFKYNMQWHGYFWKISGNPVLFDEIIKLRNRMYRSRGMITTLTSNADRFIDDHKKILALVGKGDAIKAREAMKRHIRNTKNILSKFLRENPWI